MRISRVASSVLLAAALMCPTMGRGGQAGGQAPAALEFHPQDYRLKNGLRVLLLEDHSLPLVTVLVAYGAGTIRERPGEEGLAYFLENLMFQGSENVGPLQHVGFIQKTGGELNATTTLDRALFHQSLPSNYLSLALWLESDRMKSLSITAATVEKTRADLLKEHQDRRTSDPYDRTFARFDELLFPDFRFGHPPLDAESLRKLTESTVREFYRAYYVPNNAVLCIVGDMDLQKTRDLVVRYFDSIPPGDDVPAPAAPVFSQESEVVERLELDPPASAGFHLGFRCYPLQTGDAPSLKLIEYVLLKGETSRLRRRLLRRDRTANLVNGGLEDRRGVKALKVFCLNNNDVMVDRAEKAILSEIERLRSAPISQDELAKAKRQFKMDYLRSLSTRLGRALFLVDAAFAGRPLDPADELDQVLRTNPPNLASAAHRHFIPRNRVILEFGTR